MIALDRPRQFPSLANGRNRRVSPIPVCPGERRLTQSIPGLQPEKWELALVPHSGHCLWSH